MPLNLVHVQSVYCGSIDGRSRIFYQLINSLWLNDINEMHSPNFIRVMLTTKWSYLTEKARKLIHKRKEKLLGGRKNPGNSAISCKFPNVVDNPDYWYIRMVLLNAEESLLPTLKTMFIHKFVVKNNRNEHEEWPKIQHECEWTVSAEKWMGSTTFQIPHQLEFNNLKSVHCLLDIYCSN